MGIQDIKNIERLKQYLRSYRVIRSEMAAMQGLVDMLSSDLLYLKGKGFDGMPHSSAVSNPVQDAVDAVEEARNRHSEKVMEMVRELDEVVRVIGLAPQEARAILVWRYVCGVRFDDIPERVNLSRREMFYLYKHSLKIILEKIKVCIVLH